MQTAKIGKVARWASRMAEYAMTIIYRPGKTNLVADFLSRYLDKERIEDIIPERGTCWIVSTTIPAVEEVIEQQKKELPPEGRSYVRHKGIIYYMNKIWVPPSMRNKLIEQFHNLVIYHHPGVKRTIAAIRRVFGWSGIQVDVTNYIRSCLECQRIRPGTESLQRILRSHRTEGPFEKIYIDIYEATIHGESIKCLTMIDGHSKWAEVKILQEATAREVAKVMLTTWITRYGCPKTIVADNAKVVSGKVMEQLSLLLGTHVHRATVLHPDGNAVVESFHRVLHKGLMRYALDPKGKRLEMDELIQLILYGYRITHHTSVGETPAYLTLGFDPRPPVASIYLRVEPEYQGRIEKLTAIREHVIQSAYLKKLRDFKRQQIHRITKPLEVGELILLPIDRVEASFHTIQHKGKKLMPKYTLPYRIIHTFNNGNSAKCRSLVTVSNKASEYKEASIQEIRRIHPPVTQLQLKQWEGILETYLCEFPLDERERQLLLNSFWEEIWEPQTEVVKEGLPMRKRKRKN